MKNPLVQLIISSLISVPLSATFVYYGFRDENWLFIAAAGITLFSWSISALQLRRLYQNNKILVQALTCPQCDTEGGLDFEILSQSHRGELMHAEIQEHCSECDYKSKPGKLKYPLDKEIADMMEEEKHAMALANRRAEETWYRNKVLKMVQD